MEACDNLYGLLVERLIVEGIRKAADESASYGAANDWKRLGVFRDKLLKSLNRKFKTGTSA